MAEITCYGNTFDHVYSPFRDGYKALPLSDNQITSQLCFCLWAGSQAGVTHDADHSAVV